ncbi:MAG: PEP-CTERM sorting domain-containing protein [Phycisphaeraceae bacterium JB051]
MSRSARHFAYGLVVLIITMFGKLYPASAAVWDQTDEFNIATPLFSGEVTSSIPSINPHGQPSIATSHDASESQTRDFMQQITHIQLSPLTALLLTNTTDTQQSPDIQTMQLIGHGPTIRGSGTNQLPVDTAWMACCGDGTILAAIDSSYRTLVNTQEQRPRRNASLVSMAKTGTALPLSFEVSRRVRAQSVPEPASLSVLGIGSLLLLRRRGRARQA